MRSASSRAHRARLAWVLGLGALLLGAPALAQSSPDDLARRHFESGVAYLEESDYENALTAFRKAHQLSGRPEILLNVATVHERLGQPGPAVTALKEYLAAAPEGEHAETVRRRIENLERRGAETAKPPEPAAAPEPKATPAPAPPPPAPAPAPAPSPAPVEPESKPGRVPVFIAFGVGAVSAAGAAITGLYANSEYNDAESTCKPACSDEDLSTGRAMQLTSTILTGAAVLGIGVGVTLLLLEPDEKGAEAGRRLRLELGVRATAGGPAAAGTLRF